MVLAEKILKLRKENGWSQEDLAEKMDVSRQSVSKWESGASTPDVDKIVEMAKLFEVSTDYLLKEEIEEEVSQKKNQKKGKVLSLKEANEFIELKKESGKRIGLGAMLCILSPVILILFIGLAEAGNMSEKFALGTGMIVLLLLVTVAVAMFIFSGMRLNKYEFLNTTEFYMDAYTENEVKQKSEIFQKTFAKYIVIGVCMCILSAIPLIVTGIMETEEALNYLVFVDLLLIIVSVAVLFIVKVGVLKGAYDQLLKEGDYAYKGNKKVQVFEEIYWPIITAVYLGWSFLTHNWHITWIIWPVAGCLSAGISAALGRNKED
mgnify:CR=1 FL=1